MRKIKVVKYVLVIIYAYNYRFAFSDSSLFLMRVAGLFFALVKLLLKLW